jgi:hypothetical protein
MRGRLRIDPDARASYAEGKRRNIAGARREGTNQVELDAVAAGIQALGAASWVT